MVKSILKSSIGLAIVGALSSPAGAQVPRAADGRPDLQGIWQALNTAVWDIQDHAAQLGVPAGQGIVVGNDILYLPAALARRRTTTTAD